MNRSTSSFSIVGAGIVGLLIAYRANREHDFGQIRVFDEGPDPRHERQFGHVFGATYSGMDARHVSLTETGPWTVPHRAELIVRSAAKGGWNCLDARALSSTEHAWLKEFQDIARSPSGHSDNSDLVMGINRAGLSEWARLQDELPEVFRPISGLGRLPIVCANEEDLRSEHEAEYELDPINVTEATTDLAPEVDQLQAKQEEGVIYGAFLVAGNAYNVRTLCAKLIEWLEARGVQFHWNTRVDVDPQLSDLPQGDVILAAGVSTRSLSYLAESGLLLQGVMGCWTRIPNQGYLHPFKVLAKEPVNFINATPSSDSLILSGGYGWVGEHEYAEAQHLGEPICEAFMDEVDRFFLPTGRRRTPRETAICIRPALPSGVSAVRQITSLTPGRRIFVSIGHAAGGFTQAPEVARRVLELL